MSNMAVSKNKVVFVTYALYDSNDQLFEKSDIPIGYIQGAEKGLFFKLEESLNGRVEGDKISVTLSPEEAFGKHRPDLTFTDDLKNVPPQFHRVGAQIDFQNDQGDTKTFVVSKIENGKLTVDGNHPLAGQNVRFDLMIVEVRNPLPEEITMGEPLSPLGTIQ
ncbi:MAG: peptidylprolyl isomerase [Pseudomonadota bacterium]|jgi:FKBP-type peptidyl-prolyl cis-trans isomerase SlyD